jgi:hypothetical protein
LGSCFDGGVGPSGPPLVPGVPRGPFPVYHCLLVVCRFARLAIHCPCGSCPLLSGLVPCSPPLHMVMAARFDPHPC